MGMGAMARQIRRLLRRSTPQDVHWAARGRRCPKCGGPPVVEAIIFAPAAELLQKSPQAVMRLAAENEGRVPITELRGPAGEPRKFVKIFQEFACTHHRKELS